MTRRLNTFVYEEAVAAGLPAPYFPVYAQDYFGQCAEDLIVCALLRSIAFRFGLNLAQERYLEIGGNHPIATSSSYLLHRVFMMRGVIVEANPTLLDDLRRAREDGTIVFGAVQTQEIERVQLSVSNASELSSLDRSFVLQWDGGRVGERAVIDVPALRINSLIATYLEGRAPIFLSIDTEGTDLDIVRDLDFSTYRPALIQIEPSDHHLLDNARRMAEFLASVGYVLAARTDFNLIFSDERLWRNDGLQTASGELTAESALQKLQIALKDLRGELDATSQRSQAELDTTRRDTEALRAELSLARRETESLQAKLGLARDESGELTATAQRLHNELETGRQQSEATARELALSRSEAQELHATACQLREELNTSREQVEVLQAEVTAARTESSELRTTLSRQRTDLDATREEANMLRDEAGLMRGSKSWRWTAPVRQAIRSWRALR